MDALLLELHERLHRLPFLAPPMRETVLSTFSARGTAAGLERYLRSTVAWLELVRDRVQAPEFLALSARLAAISEWAQLRAEFGLEDESALAWFRAAKREGEGARQWVCMAHGRALQLDDLSEGLEPPTGRAFDLHTAWTELFHRQQYDAALSLLEGELELGPGAYTHATVRGHLEHRFRDVWADTAIRLIGALSDSLAKVRRDRDQRVLLEAALKLDTSCVLDHDRDALRRHLDERQDQWLGLIAAPFGPGAAALRDSVLKGAAGSAHVVAGLVDALAWCRHRCGDTAGGATLCGAYFGLGSDSLTGLETLAKRIEQLGIGETGTGLSSWIALVSRTGQLDALTATFGAAFRAPEVVPLRAADDPERHRTNERWFGPEARAAALLFDRLAAAGQSGAPDKIEARCEGLVRTFHAVAGVTEVARDHGYGYLTRWLRAVEPAVADPLVLKIAHACTATARPYHVLQLLEGHFGGAFAGAASGEEIRSAFRIRHAAVCADRRNLLTLVWLWTRAQSLTDRRHEAVGLLTILFTDLFVSQSDDYKQLYWELRELPGAVPELALFIIASTLIGVGHPAGRSLCQRHLGVADGDLEAGRATLSARFAAWRDGSRDDYLRLYVGLLAESVRLAGGPARHAAALVEGFLGLGDASFANRGAVRGWMSGPGAYRPAHVPFGAPLIFQLGSAYVAMGLCDRAVLLLETWLGLETADDYAAFDWGETVARVDSTDSALLAGDALALDLVAVLLNGLSRSGSAEKYGALVNAIEREDGWLARAEGVRSGAALQIPFHVIDFFRTRDPCRSRNAAAKSVEHIRSRLRPLSGGDRVLIAAGCADLRRRIVTLGHDLILNEPDAGRADDDRRRFLCWDAELGQRLLLERVRTARPDRGSGGSDGPVRGTPARDGAPSDRGPVAVMPGCLGWRGRVPEPTSVIRSESRPEFAANPDDERADGALTEPVDESRLAAVLGEDRLLVRAGFATSGQLVWAVYDGTDGHLRVRRQGHTPAGGDARARIAAAVTRHDAALRTTWDRGRLAEKWPDLVERVNGIAELAARGDRAALGARLGRLAGRLTEWRLCSLRKVMEEQFPVPDPAASTSLDDSDWRQFWTARGAERLTPAALEAALEAATGNLLQEVDAIWDTRALAAALEEVPNRTVLVQVDDVLHSVPIAFLSTGGRFLFERVRSMHTVLSLTLDAWLGQADEEAFRDSVDEPDRILSLSWFGPGDLGPRAAAARLHAGHRHLGSVGAGREWYSAADRPQGTHACLTEGFRRHGAFRVVSVCGHGAETGAGIELGDGLWDGSSVAWEDAGQWRRDAGCDLRGVEFLIQVSCSIGRVRQTGWRDVEGFCVELAVHRARTVLAGLWPLHATDAAEYANLVAGTYLQLRANTEAEASRKFDPALGLQQLGDESSGAAVRASLIAHALSRGALRSQAVADARRRWLRCRRAGLHTVGLNTVAAFELYGRG